MAHSMLLCRFFPVFAFLSLLRFHAHGFTPTELKEIPPSASSSLRNLKGWGGFQGLGRQADLRGIRLHDSDQRKVLMMNGTADDSFVATCYPEPGFNSSSYKVVFKSDNPLVLNESTDITWSHVFGNPVSNISVIVDFNKFPGNATLTLEARRLRDDSVFDSVSVHFLAAGLVIYRNETNEILSGAGRSLRIKSYTEIYERPHMDFAVFAQYLNGSSSNMTLAESLPGSNAFAISDIKPVFHCSGQILWDPEFCSITDGTWNGTSTILKRGCGMGFSTEFNPETAVTAMYFALYFQKHRAGDCLMVFDWSGFTSNTPFDDEQFTTFLEVEILSNPPAVVRRIEPSNPFSSKGGEQLQVEMINTADVNVTSFNVHNVKFMLIKGSRHFITGPDDYYETARFLTMPGSGRSLPWTISGTRHSGKGNASEPVVFLDETGFLFSYDDDILTLDLITPNVTADVGGDVIILHGNFGTFSAVQEQNNVLFGNLPLDKKYISASSETEIKLNAPPRVLVGLESLLRITVQIGHSFSNSLNFTYLPSTLELKSYVFGASFDLKKRSYKLSSCGSTSFMVVPENYDASAALYKWNVFEKDNSTVSLLNQTSDVYPFDGVDTLEVPNSLFPSYGVAYSVLAELTFGNLSSIHEFTVQKSRNIVAGVTLIQPESRFMTVPSVHSRVVAKIDIPECFKDPTNLIYEWVYQYKGIQKDNLNNTAMDLSGDNVETQPERHIFSYENSTGPSEGWLSPIRLGRELVIPQDRLIYGVHTIQLTVRDRTQPRFFGNAITSLTVQKENLLVRIGNGSAIRTVSDSVPLYLFARSPFDLKEAAPEKRDNGLKFSWSCDMSIRANFSNFVFCNDDLLPGQNRTEFTVPTSVLQGKTKSLKADEEKIYLRYTVTVQEQSRLAEASQIVVLLKSEGKGIAQSEGVEILNSSGEAIDPTRVRFWEDIIIQPRAQPGVKWRFRLDLPYEESARFMSENENFITSPGYFAEAGSNGPHFDSLPLGILAGKLSPHQRYQFTVVFQQTGKLSTQTSIQFKTVEVPRLLFPPLAGNTGTTDTVFRASATTSFASNGTFVFQFYLMELGNPESEYCVDGCTGANIVRFSVGKPGHYTFQCRLLAADGKEVIAFMDNPETVIVTASSSVVTLESIERLIWQDYYLGDDGAVNQRAHYLAETFADIRPGSTPISENNITGNCANVTSLWASLASGFVQRDLPNTPRARNYVRIAIGCVRLGCFEREETLYDFLRLIDTTISRIPSNESLSISSFEDNADVPDLDLARDLMTFYNLTMSLAISSFAGGSSRDRLVAMQGEVSNIIIDLGELWTRHVTTVGTNKQVCGWEATYKSPISERLPNLVLRNSNPEAAIGINTMKVAVRCTPEQGTSMNTPFASFDWCGAVYDLTGSERKLITLAETVDFPFLSGIQGENRTDSARLVSVDISTLGAENRLVSALSESMIAAQARETKQEFGSCYRIGMAMKGSVGTRHEEDEYNIPFVMQPRKRFGQILTKPFEGGYYGKRTQGIRVTPETRNRSDFAVTRSNTLGLYGVERATNRSSFDRLGDTLEGTGFELVGILIGIIVLILVLALCIFAVISFVLSNRDPPALETTEAYVDRDFYGRREVRLQVGSSESASVTSGRGSGGSMGSGRSRHVVLDDENMLGDPIPREPGETAPR